MAVIVKTLDTQKRYILLGTGYGSYQALKPNWFFGNLVADKTEGMHPVAALCDRDGSIGWTYSRNMTVESIDGATPAQILEDSDTSPE